MFYEDLVGPHTAGVRGYYAGESEARATSTSGSQGGPALELPPEPPPQRITVAVTYRKLLEVTHFHLFTVPVFLLIIAHLFMLTGMRPSWKMGFIVGDWGSSLVHLAAPWLIRYGSAGFFWLYPLTGAAMAVTLGFMTAYPIMVMWAKPPERQGAAS